ncbi:hypothetical protein GY45DRAFT_1168508 [Cubamyces sp. BRFM 1775]|nr:hypothetical protein GY45DRAFT_1168508 [Cubamyces sp. BRFM 1775]
MPLSICDVSSGDVLVVDRPTPEKPDCKGMLHGNSMTGMPSSKSTQPSLSRGRPWTAWILTKMIRRTKKSERTNWTMLLQFA